MNSHQKYSTEKIVFVIFAISIYMLRGYCFLRWETYNNKFISALAELLYYIGALILVGYTLVKRKSGVRLKKRSAQMLLFAIILTLYLAFCNTQYRSLEYSDIELIALLLAFCIMTDDGKATLFEYVVKAFVIMVLPSMIYYLLERINFAIGTILPEHAQKLRLGIYYSHYPLGLIYKQSGWINRFCGIFDEAGFVGTLCAMFLAIGYKRLDKKWLIILALEGVLSFSMAFYALTIVFVIARAWTKGLYKIVGILLVLIVALLIFVNVDFHNESIAHIQSRIDLSSWFLIKDNRTSDIVDAQIDSFIQQGGNRFIFGNGRGASTAELRGSSYKFLLYDYGLIGIVLYIGFFLVYAWKEKRLNKDTIPFLTVFLASIYQRPFVYNKFFLTIFILGLSYIMCNQESANSHFGKKSIENRS